ncbi:MAG: DUF3124 domain-containing protein [Deltaproteobacteria bacterium]
MNRLSKALVLLLITLISLSLFPGLAAAKVKLLKGQTLYLPCSTSYMSGNFSFNIKATIYLRNTDPERAIKIVRMDFYNTSGKLVKKYLSQPLKLNPSAGACFHVKNPLAGKEGAVAHFVIQWQAQTRVHAPLVSGLMLGSAGTRGYTFSTHPKVLQETAD